MTIKPHTTVGNIARKRGSRRENPISQRPANTVMPKTSGNPPTVNAVSDGYRYTAEITDGAR
jgi:hypothetical protein